MGTLPNLNHGVGGQLQILSATEFRIEMFSYDGQAPGELEYYPIQMHDSV